MRRTFTASRSPEPGGKCHTDTPRMQRGHKETTMKGATIRTTARATESVDKPFCLRFREVKAIKGCLRETCTGTPGTATSLAALRGSHTKPLAPDLKRS